MIKAQMKQYLVVNMKEEVLCLVTEKGERKNVFLPMPVSERVVLRVFSTPTSAKKSAIGLFGEDKFRTGELRIAVVLTTMEEVYF